MNAVATLPERKTLRTLSTAARACRACHLGRRATRTVFGEGSAAADIMFVGEQPGNEEDLAGKPFVGPAGRLLSKALEEAGIDRSQTYLTNVVKHFKWEPRGKRRIHAKPNASEIGACRRGSSRRSSSSILTRSCVSARRRPRHYSGRVVQGLGATTDLRARTRFKGAACRHAGVRPRFEEGEVQRAPDFTSLAFPISKSGNCRSRI